MKIKYNLIQICLLGVLLLALPAVVQAQFTFTTNNGTITITGYTGSGGAVVIPSTTNGYPIIGIGENAFAYISGPTSIAIPYSITNIADGAFGGCYTLTVITVDASNSLYSSLAGVLFDKNQTTLIACPSGIAGAYSIPGGVTGIEYAAFFASALTSVTIPGSVVSIGGWAFSGSSLASVSIPNSVTNIGEAAFQQCGLTSVTIPNGVTSIAWAEFDDCVGLTNVTIPNGVTSIGGYAFCDCPLTSLTIPGSVTSIGDYAFSYCSSLAGVYFQGNAPSADSTVFTNDNNLTVVYYYAGTMGWGATFDAIPTMEIGALVVTTTSLPNGANGVAYSRTLTASGGQTPYSWSLVTGGLPSGLTLATNGLISGTPTTTGTFNFTVKVTDATNSTAMQPLTLTVLAPNLVLNGGFETGDFSGWTTNGNFTYTSVATGSTYYAHSGTFGAQLGPSGSLGFISQTLATTAGTSYLLSFWLDSPDGKTPNEFLVSWNGNTLLDQISLPVIGWTNIQFVVTATGTSTVLQFGFRDDPAYLGLDDISVVNLTSGVPSLQIMTVSLPNGTNGAAYSQTLTAFGGQTPYSWSLVTGGLPSGLTLATNGVISGTPTTSGTFNFTLKVTDATNSAATQALSLTISLSLPAQTGFTDGFELYPVGGFPTNWIQSGNNAIYVDNTTAHSGTNSLRMFGELGGCWASLVSRQLNITPPWQLVCYVKNGAERGTGCHPQLGAIQLNTGPSWTYPAIPLLGFRAASGETNQLQIQSPSDGSWLTVGTFNTNQWYKITIRYQLVATNQNQVSITYWVNDGLLANDLYTNTSSPPTNFTYLAISAQEGTAWFDDVSVSSLPPPPPQLTIIWTNSVAITYGVALGTNQLNASANAPGFFVYTPPAGVVLAAGTNTLTTVFTPTDTTDYSSATGSVSLVVLPAPLSVTASNATRAYGQSNPPFSGSITGLQNSDNITATYATTAITNSPVGTYPIIPTMLDPNGRLVNYTVAINDGTLMVTNATSGNGILLYENFESGVLDPRISISTVGTFNTYPGIFNTTVLDGSRAFGFGFSTCPASCFLSYASFMIITFPAGTEISQLSFSAVEINGYWGSQGGILLNATSLPSVSNEPGENIVTNEFGTFGSQTDSSWSSNTFVFNINQQVTNIVIFVKDITSSSEMFIDDLLVTGQASGSQTAIITWTNPTPITYGTPLSSNQLNAAANVPGFFVYMPPAGTVLAAGNNTLTTVFTPTDTVDYSSATGMVSQVVLRASLTVTASNAFRFYGQTNPVFGGTITGIQNGDNLTATYATTATTNSLVGTYPIIPALADPNGRLANYTVTTNNGTLTVNKATPAVTWTNPAVITYGTVLGTNQLNASANMPGSFVYTPIAGTVLTAGTYTLTMMFTPTDTVDYNSVTGMVNQAVSRAALTVTASNASRLYGQTNPVFNGTITGIQNGDNLTTTYATTATTNSLVGTYPIIPALVDPNGRLANYTVTTNNGALTVNRATPIVTWANPAPVIYGTALSSNQFDATANVPGSFSYNPTNGAVLNAGTNTLAVVFTPTDTNDYHSATDTVSLVVVKATPLVTWPAPSSITYGTALGSNQLNATANVPGTNAYAPPVGTVLTAGTNTLSVLFTPADQLDYTNAPDTVTLVVLRAPLTVTTSNASRAYGQPNPPFTGTIAGVVKGDNITENYTCSATSGSAPGTYSIVPSVVDPGNRLGNYTVTTNNGTLTVTNLPLPDLQVVSVAIPPEAWTGRPFDVSWVLTNAGLRAANGPWVDNVYLSVTNQLNTNQDQLLGEFAFVGTLNPGQSVQRIQTVTIPQSDSNGLYYISVFTDATNSVNEGFFEGNNVGVSVSNINVHVTPLPDLIVSSVNAPTNALGGQPVEISWIVCNQGAAGTDNPLWFDHVYLSPTTNIANAVADYGEFENPSYLAPGDCYEQSTTVTLPIGVGGSYYLIVQADSTGLLTEGNKSNNIGSTILPINIQLVQPGFLHVASVQVAPAPPTITWPGQPITCTYIVQNIGQSAITGTWDDRLTLSAVSNYVNGVTTVFIYENDITFTGPLAPVARYTNSAQFTLPQTVAGIKVTGTWYVVPVVDIHFAAGGTGFGTGNIGRDELAAPLNISTPPPADLQVTSVTAPTNAVASQLINVRWTVANNGNNQTSSGYWYDAIYLSTNSAFNFNQSTLLGTYGHFGVLNLTSNYVQNVSVTVPANLFATNLPVATYYLFVDADAGNAVYELNKTNNVLGPARPLVIQQAPPTLLADLAVTAVTAPWTAILGSQVLISWAVTNQGAGATSAGAWMDNIYLSPGPSLKMASAQLLGMVAHNGALAPGGSYSQSQMFNLPYCAIGSNHVFVQVDSGAQVNEGGATNNNFLAASPAMHIWPGNAARLGVSAVNPPANVLAG